MMCIDVPGWFSGLDWGTVPNWVSTGTVAAGVVTAAIGYNQYRRTLAVRRDDEAMQARLIDAQARAQTDSDLDFDAFTEDATPEDAAEWNRRFDVTVRNRSANPIFDLAVRIEPTSSTAASWATTRVELGGGASETFIFHEPRKLGNSIVWWVRFLDAQGRRWEVSSTSAEPRRLYSTGNVQ